MAMNVCIPAGLAVVLFAGCAGLNVRSPSDIQSLATASKPVMQIGRGLSPVLAEREKAIGEIVMQEQRRYLACYDQALSQGRLAPSEALFYFSVNEKGDFGDLSAETQADKAGKTQYADLRTCVQEILGGLKAPAFSDKLVYRFRVFFGER